MTSKTRFHIVTLFPEAFTSYVDASIVARAIRNKKIKINFYNPRDFVKPKNKAGYTQVDDRPYGGGPGMVMMAEPILKAVAKAKSKIKGKKNKIIIFSPGGKQFTNTGAGEWAKKYTDIVMISGRYEGIDARVKKILKAEEATVGPYVLTGGELPAMIVLDAMARQLPGVLGKDESVEERRISSPEVYTRPETLIYKGKKHKVPKILMSGNHAEIDKWRQSKKPKPAQG